MHSIPAFVQLEHGCFLSHRTFLRRHVTQLLGFRCGAEGGEDLASSFDLAAEVFGPFWAVKGCEGAAEVAGEWISVLLRVESDIEHEWSTVE
jgi:hypothetical protein